MCLLLSFGDYISHIAYPYLFKIIVYGCANIPLQITNLKIMISSDPVKPLNILQPVQLIDTPLPIDYHDIKKAALILRALNNKLRQLVIKTIHENIRLTVTQLYISLRLEQSVASQHLAILRKAGIVSTERDGKFVFYTINSLQIDGINKFVKNLV